MISRMLKKDLCRNYIIAISLFIFVTLSAFLTSGASIIITQLSSSIDTFFSKSKAPHFIQMHVGDIDKTKIIDFAKSNELVENYQIVTMLNIENTDMYFNDDEAEINSVMDVSFVTQNKTFDYLLNLNNEIVSVKQGKIAVPIYYMQQKKLKLGDKIKIMNDGILKEFIISDFVRDTQMNPSLINSKRFVINESDYENLKNDSVKVEYLIEFRLLDINKIDKFSNDYQSANLPQKGVSADITLFKMLNGMTDGITAGVIILVSILLIIISILCLRVTVLTTLEEDYQEIGVMKAIGISNKNISRMYLVKYLCIVSVACIFGYVITRFSEKVFLSNILLYMGTSNKNILQSIIPILVVIIIFLIVMLSCSLTLRKLKKVKPLEALQAGSMSGVKKSIMKLNKSRILSPNLFLGIKGVLGRLKTYILLCIIFLICTFIMIAPINFLNTINSPDFIQYMGAGHSDIRIDLRQTNDIETRYDKILKTIGKDKDVKKYAASVTSKFDVLNNEGVYEKINVETGDFSVFPLEYVIGNSPLKENEIALSELMAKSLEKNTGDILTLLVNEKEQSMKIVGIYQDVTNGGKTAKVIIPYNPKTVLWYMINLDVKSGIDIKQKTEDYSKLFSPAKIIDTKEFLNQTLGVTIKMLENIVMIILVIVILVLIFITSLFVKMLVTKDSSQIGILKGLGFSHRDIKIQYITQIVIVLIIGILSGTIVANTFGEKIISMAGSMMGAGNINLVVNPVTAYIICPIVLATIIIITTLLNLKQSKEYHITKMIKE